VFSSVLQRREDFPNNREQKRRAEPEQKLSVEGFDCTHEVPAVVQAEATHPLTNTIEASVQTSSTRLASAT